MQQSPDALEEQRRRSAWVPRRGLWRLAGVVLAGAVVVAMAAVALAATRTPMSRTAGAGGNQPTATVARSTPRPATCGAPGLPACPVPGQRIPLASESPAAIVAAARQSTLFQVDRSGSGDFVHDLSRLGVPQLVRALHVPGAAVASDFYALPILDAMGATTSVVLLQLDPGHTSIIVAAITGFPVPRPDGTIARMSAGSAVSAVQARRQVGLRAQAQPSLVYFPGDRAAQAMGKMTPVAGGQMPDDPIWSVPGADGKDYVVGTDGQVYTLDQLPFLAG